MVRTYYTYLLVRITCLASMIKSSIFAIVEGPHLLRWLKEVYTTTCLHLSIISEGYTILSYTNNLP